MQGYNPSFARVYNLRWGSFAQQVAPRVQTYFESTLIGVNNRRMLDLACGTGQLALHFLEHGYQVTGVDLSAAMLEHARQNAAEYIVARQARFVQADATQFSLEERFGLVVSTYDALNHLPDLNSLKSCFRSVYSHLVDGGIFIFDLNTRESLRRWTGISLEDTPELMLVLRSIYVEEFDRAYMRISGFLRNEDGLYERFEETAYNTAFNMAEVRESLLDAGFRSVRFARAQDFHTRVDEPERESRIAIIAEKGAP